MAFSTNSGMELHHEALLSELSDNTRVAYRKGWKRFLSYCVAHELDDPLEVAPHEVARFFVHMATQPSPQSGVVASMGTVTLCRSALNKKYVDSGKPSPTDHPLVRSTIKGLARLKGSSRRRVDALREYQIEAMLSACPDTLIGNRDAAVIAIGFAAALRRSEICDLNVDDVEYCDAIEPNNGGLWLNIRQSKTDQEGAGQRVAVVDGDGIRPIRRLRTWLERSGITSGPLFQTMWRGGRLRGNAMHHSDIPRLLKHYAAVIGLDPTNIAGHSLRAGFVTSAAVHHARLDKIMEVTRHKNPATVIGYIRDADAFANHAGQRFL